MKQGEVGLTSREAEALLAKHGKNTLPEKKPPSDLLLFLRQLKSPLVFILLAAGLVTLFLGDFTDATVIGVAVAINSFLGFVQERRANRALLALKALVFPHAEVVRDGVRKKINAEDVVPGDVCILNTGARVPGDGKLISANRLFISEAILTGESFPLEKKLDDKAFMGTVVTSGNGMLLIEVTGSLSEMGKIAKDIQEPYEDTPLKRQVVHFSRQLTILVIGLTLFVFAIGLFSSRPLVEIFTTSVALAVSAIPEGLLVGLTVVLAIGMQRILKKKGLVRNLVSAETLGGVTTICVDKTGTLTEGTMRVVEVIGDQVVVAKQALIANDLDDPLVVALWEWANEKMSPKDLQGEGLSEFLAKQERLDTLPFSSKNRFFATLNTVSPEKNAILVNGAPEFLLDWCDLKEAEKTRIRNKIDRLTSQGRRLIGMARKEVSSTVSALDQSDLKSGLEWIGLISFTDPIREGVKKALEKIINAKIKLIVITGDYAQTAKFVLASLGIEVTEENSLLGSELEEMTEGDLAIKLKTFGTRLFARTTPQQKLKIVQALKNNKEVVAMMGDGVNDAPALKHADIGIVVGDASDVAKESADLILIDSSFATIVAAVDEGRGIYDNLRKIVLYLMSDAFEEIVAVVMGLMFGFPLPITAVQILWINLVSDSFPHLALTVDPKQVDIMKNMPRSSREPLVVAWMVKLIIIVSIWGGLTGFTLFTYFYKTTGDVVLAQSIAFASLGINSLVYVFSVRTLRRPVWLENPFANRWLNLAVLVGVILQVLPFVFSKSREFLGISQLGIGQWSLVFLTAAFTFFMIEVMKHAFSDKLRA